ncbi:MAG: hypothetical protein ACD_58C00276G0002 [uncultured bacterium]|nr:MAG: hypothetical protein ACD_58C00276G0002 [uncultured bacterium]
MFNESQAVLDRELIPEDINFETIFPNDYDVSQDRNLSNLIDEIHDLNESERFLEKKQRTLAMQHQKPNSILQYEYEKVGDSKREKYQAIIDSVISRNKDQFDTGKVFINLSLPKKREIAGLLPSFLNRCFQELKFDKLTEEKQDDFIHAAAEIYINFLEHNEEDNFPFRLLISKNKIQIMFGNPKDYVNNKIETKDELSEKALADMEKLLDDESQRSRGTPMAVLMSDEVQKKGHCWIIKQNFTNNNEEGK